MNNGSKKFVQSVWKGRVLKKEKNIDDLFNFIFIATLAAGVMVSFFMNCVNRSLWLDEAWLASPFSTRSFWKLGDGSFENGQIAPLGWLYMEKALTLLFGNTEFVLRMGSVIGLVFSLFLIYYLMKYCFVVKYPLAACAFYANMPFILKYSNVFKPYIWDGFFVLAAAALFCLYEKNKINISILAVSWSVLIWFSNPVCFFEGGFLIAGSIAAVLDKNRKKIAAFLVSGVAISASFLFYYFYWLRKIANGDGMQHYWAGQSFPIIPHSAEDLQKMKDFTLEIFRHFGPHQNVFLAMAAVTLVIAIRKRSSVLTGCYIGILITCFASGIHMFPVEDRLWCFFYALGCILCFVGMDELLKERCNASIYIFSLFVFSYICFNDQFLFLDAVLLLAVFCMVFGRNNYELRSYLAGVAAVALVFSNDGIRHYMDRDNVYWKSEELNNQIVYLEENIKNDEKVYVYYHSVPGFEYKHGFGKKIIGNGSKENIILGETFFTKTSDCQTEIDKIVSSDKIYIASSHLVTERFARLLDAMHEKGYLQLALFDYDTPLWFYCRNLKDSKIQISYELLERSANKNTESLTIRIYNHSDAYLNHMYETVSLVNCESGDRFELQKNIAPKSCKDIVVTYEKGTHPTFRLENEYGLICENSELRL